MKKLAKDIVWDDDSFSRLNERIFEGNTPERCPELGPCWETTYAPHTELGYKKMRDASGRKVFVHRFMLTVRRKEQLPEELVVNHLCDNPGCCRPEHLEVVSNRDNQAYSNHYADFRTFPCMCLRGHVCSSPDDLYTHKGNTVQCKACMAENHTKLDKDKLREYNRQYRLANLEKIRARESRYDREVRMRG